MDMLIQDFVACYREQSFPFADELWKCIAAEGCKLLYDPYKCRALSCRHYAVIYEERRRSLEAFGFQAIPECQLFKDLVTLLALTPEEPCRVWIFRDTTGADYVVFEKVQSGIIAGCLRFGINNLTAQER